MKAERGEVKCSSEQVPSLKWMPEFSPAPLLVWGEVQLHLLRHPPRQGLWGMKLHRLSPADLALCPVLLWLKTFENGESLREGFGLGEEDVIVDDGGCCRTNQGSHPEDLGKREKEKLGEQKPA